MGRILQIVPRLSPAISGVGDYGLRLAENWRQSCSLESEFLVTDPEWKGEKSLNGFRVNRLNERNAAGLVGFLKQSSLSGVPILLHYVGHGYARRGVPWWLVRGMRASLRDLDPQKAAVFFHELFASGPPWTSAFWLSPIQQWICHELGELVSVRFTNRAASAQWLDQRSVNRKRTQVLPVFSNLGEPGSLTPLEEREPQLVIYGGISREGVDAFMAAQSLRRLIERLGLKRVVAFGTKRAGDANLGIPIDDLGILSPEEVSALLLKSRVAYLDYFNGFLGKSGVFAAYCAHGVVPVLLRSNHSEQDGLFSGRHFLVASEIKQALQLKELRRIADDALAWYRQHSITVTARVLAAAFG